MKGWEVQDNLYQGTVFGRSLNVRYERPSVNAARRDLPLLPGDKVEVVRCCYGDDFEGNDEWLQLVDGTFVWSGCVALSRKPPIMQKPILFTADDYGIVDEIDDGVIAAVEQGLINTVEVLPNPGETESKYENTENKVKRLLEAASVGFPQGGFNLGIHFTIVSGKPVCPDATRSSMTNRKGFFRKYSEIHPLLKGEEEWLRRELKCQIEAFGPYAEKINHATSHFDALTFHSSHFEVLLDICSAYGWGIRNFEFDPGIKRVILGGTADQDWISVRKLHRIRDQFNRQTTEYPVLMSDITYVDHYVTLARVLPLSKEVIRNQAKKKWNTLQEIARKHHQSSSREIGEVVFHLIEDKFRTRKQCKALLNKKVYPGLASAYFDGRQVEIKSLLKFGKVADSKYVRWGSYDEVYGR